MIRLPYFFPLFLPDFRGFVKNKDFKSEQNVHPVMYFEIEEGITRFYKPVGNIVYYTTISVSEVPRDINITLLKREFNAIELPSQPDKPYQITGLIS